MLTIVENKDCLMYTFVYNQNIKQSLFLIDFCANFLKQNEYLSFFNMN